MTTFIGRATCVLALVLVSSSVEARHHAAKHAAHRQSSRSRASRPASTKNAQAKVDTKANDLSGLPGF